VASTKPCVVYNETLDVSIMEQVKLETVVAGAVRSKEVPVFTASYGVEGLLHVIDTVVQQDSNQIGLSAWRLVESI